MTEDNYQQQKAFITTTLVTDRWTQFERIGVVEYNFGFDDFTPFGSFDDYDSFRSQILQNNQYSSNEGSQLYEYAVGCVKILF
jgi:hypothetical protein